MTPPRRFTLLDSMILVAAVAVGAALNRTLFSIGGVDHSTKGPLGATAIFVGLYISPCWLVPFTLAALALRIRGATPPVRLAFRSPGMAGCLAALPGLLIANAAPAWMRMGIIRSLEVGASIVGAWFVLAALGYWQEDRDWVDRLGRLVCLGWLASASAWLAGPLMSLL
jgi:hypothetical protein